MYKNAKTIENFFRNTAKGIAHAIRKWNGYERIADKLENIPAHVYTDIYKEYLPLAGENAFNTLIHGDLWMTNILFKYGAENIPIETKWVGQEFWCNMRCLKQ